MVSNDELGRFTLHRKVAVSRRRGVYGLLNVHANPTCHGAHLAHVISYGCARVAALVRPWPELQSTRVLTSGGEGGGRTRIEAPFSIASVKEHVNSRHNPVGCRPYISPEESNLRGPHTAIVLPHRNRRCGDSTRVQRSHASCSDTIIQLCRMAISGSTEPSYPCTGIPDARIILA